MAFQRFTAFEVKIVIGAEGQEVWLLTNCFTHANSHAWQMTGAKSPDHAFRVEKPIDPLSRSGHRGNPATTGQLGKYG
jgi:hypothetical protein